MRVCDINPHVRYAQQRFFKSNAVTSNVFDCRIFYIVSGQAEISVADQHFVLTENTLFYCAAGSIYTIGSPSGCTLLIFNFDLEQSRNSEVNYLAPLHISSFQKPRFKNESLIDDCEILNSCFALSDSFSLYSTLQSAVKEFNEKKIFFREKCSVILKNILIDIYRTRLSCAKISSTAVESAVNYIKENYMFQISNKDISRVSCYHEYHLNRLFLKYTGMTIHRYILEIRISEAKNLLINSNMQINEIAAATGFNTNTHFATCFKKNTGLSPQEYKNSYSNTI